LNVIDKLNDLDKRLRALEQDNAVIKAKMNLIAWLAGASLVATVSVLVTVIVSKVL